MRLPSPQLEHIASPTSPTHIKSAVNMLLLLQSRAARLQAQIAALESESKCAKARIQQIDARMDSVDHVSLKSKLCTLEEMVLLASGHWYELFVLECSLRDVIDEESGTLGDYVDELRGEFEELVRTYDMALWEIMVKGCPEAVHETVREIVEEGNILH
jgi:hypothetical protein